ncbi:hypothetical protein [Hathewaya limosa]|uniref:Sporulation membrane protein YtrI C-terminal domain-containing protein n=1 Tax=Hathewaya limosa TaxID=1536 RepID=A0ABU0JRX2_HATLI|nr:hypothetical protein [Hathewaya limosa]MDQ0479836.1 hypothetical protein [Hathewaya limosa]
MDEIKKKYLIFFVTGCLVGILVSIISFTIFFTHKIEKNYSKIRKMQIVLEEKNKELERIKTSIKVDKYTVNEIEVKIDFKSKVDEVTTYILEKSIKDKFSSLIGREVNSIDVEMLEKVIDNRIMYVENSKFLLKLKRISVSERIKIFIEGDKIEF